MPAAPVRVEVNSLSAQSERDQYYDILGLIKPAYVTYSHTFNLALGYLKKNEKMQTCSATVEQLTGCVKKPSPETSIAKVSLLTPAALKATHSTVILRLEGPTVRTLSTSTAPYSSLWTSTVGAWSGIAICSPVVFSLHLSHTHTQSGKVQLTGTLELNSIVQFDLRGSYSKTLIPDDSGSWIPK